VGTRTGPARELGHDEAAFRRGIRARCPRAWSRLYELYDFALRRQAAILLPASSMDAENAVGDAWLAAIRSAHKYDPRRPPYPWLARICANVCLEKRRSLLRRLAAMLLAREEAPAQHGAGASAETSAAIRAALGRLWAREREAVALRFLYSVSVGEIAVLLACSPTAVSMAIRRGLDRLRREAGVDLRRVASEAGWEGSSP